MAAGHADEILQPVDMDYFEVLTRIESLVKSQLVKPKWVALLLGRI